LAAVIGWPVRHSLSPLIHAIWAEREGASAYYVPVAAAPLYEDFARVADGLQAAGFRGANITVPHKEHALRYASRATQVAEAVGAANMLTFEPHGALADNSDVEGFAAAISPSLRSRRMALLLGAGGAARAVAVALSERCAAERILIANRTRGRAEALAGRIGGETVDWKEIERLLPGADLVVNATTLGMQSAPPLDIDFSNVNPSATVCDLVYRPLETPLLKAARARGCRTVDGLEMLMRQAVRGYEMWLGDRAVVDGELRGRLEKALGRSSP
jgi:shikimate dehydrogenase